MERIKNWIVFAFMGFPLAGLASIEPSAAASHVGEQVVVRGQVAQVSRIGSGMTFLNFGQPHPNSVFTAVVRSGVQGVPDLLSFQGKVVEVEGTVELHKGKPQIDIRQPSQLRLADGTTGSPPILPSSAVPETIPIPIVESPLPPPAEESSDDDAPSKAESIRPGSQRDFRVKLTPEESKDAGKGPGGDLPTEAVAAVMTPQNFDPSKAQKVLVVFATDDNGGAHVQSLNRFGRVANELGWVAVAANGPVLDKSVSPEWHAVMILAALRELEKQWPGMKSWKFYTGGNSGGAARASMMSCALLKEDYDVEGVFMGSYGGERFRAGMDIFKLNRSALRKVAVFAAFGKTDHMLNEAAKGATESGVKAAGVKDFRRVDFEGGHGMNPETLREGLKWLASE